MKGVEMNERDLLWVEVESVTPEPYSDNIEFYSPKDQKVHKGHYVGGRRFFCYERGEYHDNVAIWRPVENWR